MNNAEFFALVGEEDYTDFVGHNEELGFEGLLRAVGRWLEDKSVTLDTINGHAVTVLYEEEYLILEGQGILCRVLVGGHDWHYLEATNYWPSSTLRQLPKGTIGRWLHPEIEAELWRLESEGEEKREKKRAEAEKARRFAEYERLRAEFEAEEGGGKDGQEF